MPTLTRQPDVPVTTMPGGIVTGHGGDSVEVGAPASPPGELLPTGGPDRFEVRELGCSGGRLRRAPVSGGFEWHVRAIHRQLLPLRSRAALASSYQREAAHWGAEPDPLRPVRTATALHFAYALRWVELGEG